MNKKPGSACKRGEMTGGRPPRSTRS